MAAAAAARALELRLLRCSFPSSDYVPPPQVSSPPAAVSTDNHHHNLHSLLNDVVSLIESGHYLKALSSPASQSLFSTHLLQFDFLQNCKSSESAHAFYSDTLPDCITLFLSNNINDEELGYKALLVMIVAVAALLAFIQSNMTGPLDHLPLMPLVELLGERGDGDWIEWEAWSQREIMSVGADLRAKFSNLQYLIFAKTLLMRTKDLLFEGDFPTIDGVRSIPWWLARALFLHQKLLDAHSSSLFDQLQVFKSESLFSLGTVEKINDYWCANDDCSTILAMLHLEMGMLELYYARVDACRLHFESAAEISNYNYFVCGALGFRTVHQVKPTAQLRLVAGTKAGDTHDFISNESSITDNSPIPETSEESDILMTPKFVADERHSEIDEHGVQYRAIESSQLTAVHQAMILAQCLFIEKSARSDELQMQEMAPYIEAIDSQKSSPFILRCLSNILRVRWESTRNRTKQRAVVMMDKLVEGIYSSSPGVAQRVYYCFGVNMPSIAALRKEYGDLLISCGLTGEAIKIYEDLELWDNLIYCYQIMDKKTAAVDLIKKCLAEKPLDPRLWCSLGDVTNDDTSYNKALEVSGNRSARAFRSLARSAYNRGDYEKSKTLWQSAMALNSMYPDGWFGLGAACLKSRDVDKALDAFTRAVQFDPENGEAWNNIACLHMIKKRNKESFIAFTEALKLKRDSWQMWENFGHVAADTGNFGQAILAVQNVVDKTKMKRVDFELLERIMLEIEAKSLDLEMRVETEHLMQMFGKLLKCIVQNGGNGDTWGLYARWHKLRGDLVMCSEAFLKQVRSYQGSDLWKDKDRFTKFARASLELCKIYRQLALKKTGGRELFAAEMHLKSTIKQATVNFSDSEEFKDLVACLEDVQGAIKAIPLPGT